jgi:hypothetical protein
MFEHGNFMNGTTITNTVGLVPKRGSERLIIDHNISPRLGNTLAHKMNMYLFFSYRGKAYTT